MKYKDGIAKGLTKHPTIEGMWRDKNRKHYLIGVCHRCGSKMFYYKGNKGSKVKNNYCDKKCISKDRELSEEHKRNIGKARKGRKHSEETKRKMSEVKKGCKGRKQSEETKKKLSSYMQGRYVGDKHPFYGKKHSEESKRKMSVSTSGKSHPLYIDGQGNYPYTSDFTKELKVKIKVRDGGVCQGRKCSSKSKNYCVHHVDRNHINCNEWNLIYICLSCNMKAAHNLIKDYIYYTSIMGHFDPGVVEAFERIELERKQRKVNRN